MEGKAFIKMMRQDIETHKQKEVLSTVVDAMEYIVNENPGCDIDSKKTAEECYQKLFDAARASTGEQNGSKWCCATPAIAYKAIRDYLGLSSSSPVVSEVTTSDSINLEDFL